MKIFIAIILSYLLGSVPVGYIICRLLKGIDIRSVGSGNIGATNVGRVVGKRAGITTLFLDILKGFIAVFFIPRIIGDQSELLGIICALGVVAGHNWTIFLKFKGGKGVAATSGALIGLMPVVFFSSFCVWSIVFVLWRYVSLASIISAIFLPVFLFLYGEPLVFKILGFIIAIIGIYRHKENINRLLKREENKFTFKKK
jgi:glycerol-3-phosphate acyltransferase PlsY